jgi:DNA anti-recombination protein RmuC
MRSAVAAAVLLAAVAAAVVVADARTSDTSPVDESCRAPTAAADAAPAWATEFMNALGKRLDEVRDEMREQGEALGKRLDEVRDEMGKRLDEVRDEMGAGFSELLSR